MWKKWEEEEEEEEEEREREGVCVCMLGREGGAGEGGGVVVQNIEVLHETRRIDTRIVATQNSKVV